MLAAQRGAGCCPCVEGFCCCAQVLARYGSPWAITACCATAAPSIAPSSETCLANSTCVLSYLGFEGFGPLLSFLGENSELCDCIIISDANTLFIETILSGLGLSEAVLAVFSNPAVVVPRDDGSAPRLVRRALQHPAVAVAVPVCN